MYWKWMLIAGCMAGVWTMSQAADAISVIPKPVEMKVSGGAFKLDSKKSIYANKATFKVADFLAKKLRTASGLPLPMISSDLEMQPFGIRFEHDPSLKNMGAEGYKLTVSADAVVIASSTDSGLFYGAQTLLQLFPPEIFTGKKTEVDLTIPCLTITDAPRFHWRGFMLDAARHFFTVQEVKELLDWMAAHKLNRFHFHLTDDQGWRIEIKKYPKLTAEGAWRGTKHAVSNSPNENFETYGGFYTQEELKDIVAYAKTRFIEIMPEIDFPGHSRVICAVYPEVCPSKVPDVVSVQGVKLNAISPVSAQSMTMVADIMAEVAAIFPFDYIHIGGDEVNHSLWGECPEIKAYMEKHKITSMHALQVDFTKRLEQIIKSNGKKMVGWVEIMGDNLDKGTGIMPWLGAGAGFHAAKAGHPVIMIPGQHCYYDMPYPRGDNEPPCHFWAGAFDVAQVYRFDPLPKDQNLSPEAAANILGVQGAFFSEYAMPFTAKDSWLVIKNERESLHYKIWPRLCALSEVMWTPQEKRDLDDFRNRMGPIHYQRLYFGGLNVRIESPEAILSKGEVTFEPPFDGAIVRYTLDGSLPVDTSTVWDHKPMMVHNPDRIRARTQLPKLFVMGPARTGVVIPPVAAFDCKGMEDGVVKTMEFDISKDVNGPGFWKIELRRTGGNGSLSADSIVMILDGQPLVPVSVNNTRAKFNITVMPKKIMLKADVKVSVKKGKPEVKGDLLLSKVALIPCPDVTVECAIKDRSKNQTKEMTVDRDPETFFRSYYAMQSGETMIWRFKTPFTGKTIAVTTGLPGESKDMLINGVLEVSENGTDFISPTPLNYGKATFENNGKTLRAFRIRATKKNDESVAILDPEVK